MDLRGLSNHQLLCLAGQVGLTHLAGVFMIDELPLFIAASESGIINLQSSSELGSHWCAYYNHPNLSEIFYFDSYGDEPPQQIIEFLSQSKKQICHNLVRVQRTPTECGWLCLEFIVRCQEINEDLNKNPIALPDYYMNIPLKYGAGKDNGPTDPILVAALRAVDYFFENSRHVAHLNAQELDREWDAMERLIHDMYRNLKLQDIYAQIAVRKNSDEEALYDLFYRTLEALRNRYPA